MNINEKRSLQFSETYGVTIYGNGWRKYVVTSYGNGWRKDVVTSYGSGWKKDVVNQCLEFGQLGHVKDCSLLTVSSPHESLQCKTLFTRTVSEHTAVGRQHMSPSIIVTCVATLHAQKWPRLQESQ